MAAKYGDIIKVLIVDRSMSELIDVAEANLRGETTITLMKGFVNGWICDNSKNFALASDCYKILTCDKDDDTVD